jgi:tetratricopeptide (TPR) repeat protein
MLQTEVDAFRQRLARRARVESLLQEAEDGFKARDAPGSLARLEQAEALGLDGAEQISRAGYLWLNLGRHARAEARLDEVILLAEPSSHYLYQALAGRGAARLRLRHPSEGLADLAAAKALDPDQPLAYLLLGLALSEVGDRAGALREFRAGLAKTPTDERLRRAITLTSALRR